MNRSIAIVFVDFLAWSSAALDQPAGAQAEVLFRQGRELLAAGKVAEACSAFEESQKLEPAVTTLLNLAGCREKQGQLATVWGVFLDAARQTWSATDATKRQLHEVAQARAKKLEPRVSKLTVNVSQESQIDGLEVARGRDRINAGMWNRALPVDGDTYTITAHAPGSSAWSTQVTVGAEGDTRTVEIPDLRNLPRDLGKAPTLPSSSQPPTAAVVAPASEPPSPRPIGPSRPSRKVVPFAVGAGALALLGGGLGFELWAESRYGAAKVEMMSQPRRDSLESAFNTKRYVAEALAVGGLAAGGAAVWLYLRDGKRERPAPGDASVHVVPTVTGLALAGRF
jgi:hypothetical protein